VSAGDLVPRFSDPATPLIPIDVPIIRTDLEIKPVRVGAWADIGTNATILPGVTIGKGAIVGAGAVVVSDVEPFSVVAGVPAKFMRWRSDSDTDQHPERWEADMKDKRILITGGSGLIGSHIADLVALEEPREIMILDNFVRGRRENLAQAEASAGDDHRRRHPRSCFAGKGHFEGVDIVFHQAAIRITQCAEDPTACVRGPGGGPRSMFSKRPLRPKWEK
jgi:hypothetical protein